MDSPSTTKVISSASLVSLSPPDVLTFTLIRNSSPKTVLKVTNNSNAKVAFKIKTTQPTWYYVRPNQQIVDVDKTEEVTVVLVDTECNKFLDQLGDDQIDKQLDKHRFLVQSKIIDDETFNKISSLPHNQRADEYAKVWDSGKDDKKNLKLRVEFSVPDSQQNVNGSEPGLSTSNAPTSAPIASVSEAMENVRKRIPKDTSSSSTTITENAPSSAIFSELQGLRKKYDAVVEYTVHLTAERDFHFSQLEELKRELTREKAKKKDPASVKGGKLNEKIVDKKGGQQGFSLFVLLILALVAFFAGRFMKS